MTVIDKNKDKIIALCNKHRVARLFVLEKLLKRQIDLLEDQAVKNPYLRKSIDSSKKIIYG
jgi:predicted nucleotidyltransferase